jgi:hypothetical protein
MANDHLGVEMSRIQQTVHTRLQKVASPGRYRRFHHRRVHPSQIGGTRSGVDTADLGHHVTGEVLGVTGGRPLA